MNKKAYFKWFKENFRPQYSKWVSDNWSTKFRYISKKRFGSRMLASGLDKKRKEFLVDMAVFRKGAKEPQLGKMEIAIEWQWNFNNFYNDFLIWDFPKLLHLDAKLKVAIFAGGTKRLRDRRAMDFLYDVLRKFKKGNEVLVIQMEILKSPKQKLHRVVVSGIDFNNKKVFGQYEMIIEKGRRTKIIPTLLTE